MTIHEFGDADRETVLLIHPSMVRWDYFAYVIPLLSPRYHLVVPALPGYDLDQAGDFTGVEDLAGELAAWLHERGRSTVKAAYGCSMGGSIVLRMAVDRNVQMGHAILDGAITPYQLPRPVTRLILLRDFSLLAVGKLGGEALLARAFSTDEYSAGDMRYVAGVLRRCSCKTLWRTFDSCNNYTMPSPLPQPECRLHYWFAEREEKTRRRDIRYMKERFPGCTFRKLPGLGHGGLAALRPQLFADLLVQTLSPSARDGL